MMLSEFTYAITKGLPKEEKYGLVSRMRLASYSVSSNIAEGSARDSQKSFNQFLNIAQGSLAELHTQYILCKRIGHINDDKYDETKKIIVKLKNGIYKFQQQLKSQMS